MPVATQNGEVVLHGKGRDPRVVGRNGCPSLFQPNAQHCVGNRRLLGHREDVELSQVGVQPLFIGRTVPRFCDPVPKFPEDDYRDTRARLMAE